MQDAMKSKRFVTYISAIITLILVGIIPGLEPYAGQLQIITGVIATSLILGYSSQDTASAKQGLNKYIPTLPEVQPEATFRNDASEINVRENTWAVTSVDLNEIAQG